VAPEGWLKVFLKIAGRRQEYNNYDITCGLDAVHRLGLYEIMPYLSNVRA
jgi:hypothetical protein